MARRKIDFKSSFYGLWFQCLPDEIINNVINDIEHEHRAMRNNCPALYDEFIHLNAVMFLLTFIDVGDIEVEVGGEKVALKSLANSGAIAYVKRDSIDSSLTREYYKPELPDGMALQHFPLGRLQSRIDHITNVCSMASIPFVGFGSNNKGASCGQLGNRALQSSTATRKQDKCTRN